MNPLGDTPWLIALGIGFPLLLLALNELIIRSTRRQGALTSTLRSLRNLLLPALGAAAIVRFVLAQPAASTTDLMSQTVVWVILLFVLLTFLNDVVFGAAPAGSWRASVPDLFRDIVRAVLVGVGAAFIYSQIWGKELAGALTALGVGSLVIGLALQEPLGNVFSGIMLLFERPVSPGDWITVENQTGKVTSLNWRAAQIETRTREVVVVPNSSLYKTVFLNLSRPTKVRTETFEMGYSYDDPPTRVKQVVLSLLDEVPGVLKDPAPAVRTLRYADFSVIYLVVFSVADMETLLDIRDEVMTRLWYASQRGGLTIPYPIAVEVGDDVEKMAARRHLDPQKLLDPYPAFRATANAQRQILYFAPGEFLLREGDEQDGLGLVTSGEAVWLARDAAGAWKEIGRVAAGDFYGEHSLLAGQASTAALRAATDVQVVLFDLDASRKLAEQSAQFARTLGDTIEQRRRAAQSAHQKSTGA